MFQFIIVVILACLGLGTAEFFNIHDLHDYNSYSISIKILLAIGLYASVYGIDLNEFKNNKLVIGLAVTLGVLLKILLIGGSLYLLTGNVLFFLIGAIVAQIDPLSVAALVNSTSLSKKAKTVLISWASFDDPVTIIAAIYIASLLFVGQTEEALSSPNEYLAYLKDFIFNIGIAAGAFAAHKALKNIRYADYFIFLIIFVLAIANFWMLGLTITALFLRPKFSNLMEHSVTAAFYIAAFLLGILLIEGIDFQNGVFVAVAAIIAQIITGLLLTRNFSSQDRIQLAFAQQNGVTAIILALYFEPQFPGIISIVAPAILFINLFYILSHETINKYFSRK